MNSNLVKRSLTCIIGIPALLALIFLFPMKNFIAISALVILLSLLGSVEMSRLVFKRVHFLSFFSWIYLLFIYLENHYVAEYVFVFLLLACFFWYIRRGEKDNFKTSIGSTARLLSVVLYPSFFLSYLIRFLALENVNEYVVFMYLILVFANDIFAYVFGMLFGKNNAGVFKVSPKKSIAGFAGGFASCIGICFLYCFIFKGKMPAMTVSDRLTIGITVSLMANVGDLAESVFKRSANIKDSGNIIPGRGGVLDCTDSICATAPVIYFIFRDIIL